jgi:hypothetical protein
VKDRKTMAETKDGGAARPQQPMSLPELAQAIYSLRYEDLRDIGRELYTMTHTDDDPPVWDLDKETEWAEILFCWAEANIPGAED